MLLAVVLALYADSRGAPWWGDLFVSCAPLLLVAVPAGRVVWTTIRRPSPVSRHEVSSPTATIRRV
jgi:hypothetical protein